MNIVWSRQGCAYCDMAKNLLDQNIKLTNKTPDLESWGRRMLTQRLIKEVLT